MTKKFVKNVGLLLGNKVQNVNLCKNIVAIFRYDFLKIS